MLISIANVGRQNRTILSVLSAYRLAFGVHIVPGSWQLARSEMIDGGCQKEKQHESHSTSHFPGDVTMTSQAKL